jgi:hypothetical protein
MNRTGRNQYTDRADTSHCIHGHLLSPENVIIREWKSGPQKGRKYRQCRECRKKNDRDHARFVPKFRKSRLREIQQALLLKQLAGAGTPLTQSILDDIEEYLGRDLSEGLEKK